ncbi:MAG TPA: hypothetical protein VHW24_16235 [Bryobacteraceae bacterium]|nr:hypothetical protein [Bryobacteraceae bacterium]
MAPEDSRLLLLMIHGVNSTLEWSSTVLSVLEPHFQPRLVRYRYFHTLWGPVKVYIWPTALLYLLGCGALKWRQVDPGGRSSAALAILIGLLLFETFVAVQAEFTWSKGVERTSPVWIQPACFSAIGVVSAFLLSSPWQYIAPVAFTAAVAVFLDMREYGGRKFESAALWGLPVTVAALSAWGAEAFLLAQPAAILIAAVAGVLEPFLRCHLAFARVAQEIQKAREDHPIEPFVVAHSLGTYLTAHVLHEKEWVKLGRILFTGCVLDRRFPLEKLVSKGSERLISLTNHVGRIDIVPVCTGFLRGAWCFATSPGRIVPSAITDFIRQSIGWRPLGGAGSMGFKNRPEVVHTMSMSKPCAACAASRAVIHNIDHGWARHSTLNNDRDFQEWYWIPALWGIDVHQYESWLDYCRKGYFYSRPTTSGLPKNPVSARRYEQSVLNGPWSWPSSPELHAGQPQTLENVVAEYLAAIDSKVPARQLMQRIPHYLFETVEMAVKESKSSGGIDAAKIEWLRPQMALQRAVLLALQTEPLRLHG